MSSSMLRKSSLRCQWDTEVEWGGGGVALSHCRDWGSCRGYLHPHFPGIQKSWGVRAPCTSSDPPSLSHLCLFLVSVFLLLLSLSLSHIPLSLSHVSLSLTFSSLSISLSLICLFLCHGPLLPASCPPPAVPSSLSLSPLFPHPHLLPPPSACSLEAEGLWGSVPVSLFLSLSLCLPIPSPQRVPEGAERGVCILETTLRRAGPGGHC